MKFAENSAFMLSVGGADFARSACPASAETPDAPPKVSKAPACETDLTNEAQRPHWEPGSRTLTIGDIVVKRFHRPARVQAIVFGAFEEEGWPASIDDPIPRHPGKDPKTRLRGTIESLNENHLVRRIHFAGDGSGEKICWSFVDS
jgi:hypothetical protein